MATHGSLRLGVKRARKREMMIRIISGLVSWYCFVPERGSRHLNETSSDRSTADPSCLFIALHALHSASRSPLALILSGHLAVHTTRGASTDRRRGIGGAVRSDSELVVTGWICLACTPLLLDDGPRCGMAFNSYDLLSITSYCTCRQYLSSAFARALPSTGLGIAKQTVDRAQWAQTAHVDDELI
jgi:hypothetical protein